MFLQIFFFVKVEWKNFFTETKIEHTRNLKFNRRSKFFSKTQYKNCGTFCSEDQERMPFNWVLLNCLTYSSLISFGFGCWFFYFFNIIILCRSTMNLWWFPSFKIIVYAYLYVWLCDDLRFDGVLKVVSILISDSWASFSHSAYLWVACLSCYSISMIFISG